MQPTRRVQPVSGRQLSRKVQWSHGRILGRWDPTERLGWRATMSDANGDDAAALPGQGNGVVLFWGSLSWHSASVVVICITLGIWVPRISYIHWARMHPLISVDGRSLSCCCSSFFLPELVMALRRRRLSLDDARQKGLMDVRQADKDEDPSRLKARQLRLIRPTWSRTVVPDLPGT